LLAENISVSGVQVVAIVVYALLYRTATIYRYRCE
jgi:hypothetical protein